MTMAPKKLETSRPGAPQEVKDAWKQPIPTRVTAVVRNTLLPYLTLGFTPVKTSGGGQLCGINALWKSFREARIALQSPDAPSIRHLTQQNFKDMLNSKLYKEIVANYLKDELKIDEIENEAVKKELIDNFKRKTNLDVEQLILLLRVANMKAGTHFRLGVITQGYRCRWDGKKKTWDASYLHETTSTVYGEADGYPIIWIFNNNDSTSNAAWGGHRGAMSHWEGFGPYDPDNKNYRDRVQSWNLGQLMRSDVEAGVWRVIAEQDASDGQLKVEIGAFVREVTPPSGIDVPKDWKYMTAPDNKHVGFILDASLAKIKLHPNAPTYDPNLPAPIDPEAGMGGPATASKPPNQGNTKTNTDLRSLLALFTPFRILRTVTPTNKVGGPLTADELPQFQKGELTVAPGQFLLDLSQRDNNWCLVRTIWCKEGWAHSRCLQAIEFPWGLPGVFPFLISGGAVDPSWDQDRVVEEARKRGLDSSEEKDDIVARITAWESLRTASLPMRFVTQARSAEEARVQFLASEFVLEIGEADEQGKVAVVSFEGDSGVIDRDNLSSTVLAAWDVRMTPEELLPLLNPRVPITGTGGQNRQADKDEREEEATDSGKKHPFEDDIEGQPCKKPKMT